MSSPLPTSGFMQPARILLQFGFSLNSFGWDERKDAVPFSVSQPASWLIYLAA